MSNTAFTVDGVAYPNGVTQINTGAGLTGGPITNSGTISVLINSFVQGRLTLTSGVPVTTNDAAGTVLYFTPYKGNYITLYTGGAWQLYTFTELNINIPATTNQMYDAFVYDSGGGTLSLYLLPWTNDTTRATTLTTQDGVYVLTGAKQYRYVGSIRTTTVAGQCEDSTARRYVWNYYNRVLRQLRAISSTPSWVYTVTAWRQANLDSSNQVNFVLGLIEDAVYAYVAALGYVNSGFGYGNVGLGINSTTIPNNGVTIASYNAGYPTVCSASATPSSPAQSLVEGYNYIAWLEYGIPAGFTFVSNGSIGNSTSGIDATVFS